MLDTMKTGSEDEEEKEENSLWHQFSYVSPPSCFGEHQQVKREYQKREPWRCLFKSGDSWTWQDCPRMTSGKKSALRRSFCA